MLITRYWRVSICLPGPTTSSHHPDEGSCAEDATCLDAEMPPRTATTGAPGGPMISYLTPGSSTCAGRHAGSLVEELAAASTLTKAGAVIVSPPGRSPARIAQCKDSSSGLRALKSGAVRQSRLRAA